MRKINILVVLFALCLSAHAQNLMQGPAKMKVAGGTQPCRVMANAQGTQVFNYGSADSYEELSVIGFQMANTFDAAVFVPARYAGKSIETISVWLYDATVMKDLKIWASSALPNDVDESDGGCVSVENAQSQAKNTVTLPTPFVVPADGCYIGYTFTIKNATTQAERYPMCTFPNSTAKGGLIIRCPSVSDNQYVDYESANLNSLTLEATISGDYPSDYAAISSTFDQTVAVINGSGKVKVAIKNMGGNDLQSLTYTCTTEDGVTLPEQTIQLDKAIKAGKEENVVLSVPADATTGLHQRTITVTKANGQTNSAADIISAGKVITVSQQFDRNVLMEEFTGIWCGFCPRGIVGMEMLTERYPESFIGIAAHYNDIIALAEYDRVTKTYTTGYPGCTIDRTVSSIDPYYGSSGDMFGIEADFVKELETPAVAGVNTYAGFTDDTRNLVKVMTYTTFGYDMTNANYTLAYVITEDGMSGEGYDWAQHNYFAKSDYKEYYGSDPNLKPWTEKGTYYEDGTQYYYLVYGQIYDHVAVAADNVTYGITGSVAKTIKQDEAQLFERTIDITSNSFVQDRSKLSLVTMLLDRSSGKVVNSCKVPLGVFDATGITSAQQDSNATVKEVARYTVDGKFTAAPVKGVNIVKMSDGTTRKEMVK